MRNLSLIGSETIARAMYRHWICEKGVPFQIVLDRGKELISTGVKKLWARLKIYKVETAGYNPTGNSTVERFHRYLGASLSFIYKNADWDEYLPAVLFS